LVLDLGGGRGMLREPLEQQGHRYVNLDMRRQSPSEPTLVGDAHQLPFADEVFDYVISKDTLEHFQQPWTAVREIHRVLRPGGHLILMVPFMHPFHSDDFYRYTPLGLRHMLNEYEILRFDSPQWVFTVLGVALIQLLNRAKLGFLQNPIQQICWGIDGLFTKGMDAPKSFAAHYRVVARKAERHSSPAPNDREVQPQFLLTSR
jgi:SAM-dependent methyltransferase